MRRLVLIVLLAGLWLLASGSAAHAHALLRDSQPASGASLDRAPRQVVLTFTERPEPRLFTIQVLDTAGAAGGGRPRHAGGRQPAAAAGAAG